MRVAGNTTYKVFARHIFVSISIMDSLSITTASANIVRTCGDFSSLKAKIPDELQKEIESLARVSGSINKLFSNQSLAHAALESHTGYEVEHWRDVRTMMEDCTTVLRKILEDVKSGSPQYDKQTNDFMLSVAEIADYRHALEVSLQLITGPLTKDAPTTLEGFMDKVDLLLDLIRNRDETEDDQDSSSVVCLLSAKSILSSKINTKSKRSSTARTPTSSVKSSQSTNRKRSLSDRIASVSLDRSDYVTLLRSAEKKLEAREYEEAVAILESTWAPGQEETLRMLAIAYFHLGKWDDADMVVGEQFEGRDETLKLLVNEFCEEENWEGAENVLRYRFEGRDQMEEVLAMSYYDRGKWDEAEKLLLDLVRGRKEFTVQGLHALHVLANIKYNKQEYEDAEDFCIRAMNGRRMILGNQHVSYFQSVNLLSEIYRAEGDLVDAAECKAILPPGYNYCLQLERLSRMPPKEAAASIGVEYLKDIFNHDARKEVLWRDVRHNIEVSGKGIAGSGHGYSLLHGCADWGYKLAAQFLLEKGADIEARTKDQETPLILASESGMEKTVILFLESGANLEAEAAHDRSTALIRAVRRSRVKIVDLLLEKGANIEARDSEGDTPLILAVLFSTEEMVNILLERGAKIGAQNDEGRTSLMCAVIKSRPNIVELLIAHNADIDARDNKQKTALNYAKAQRNSTIIKILEDEAKTRKSPTWYQRRFSLQSKK